MVQLRDLQQMLLQALQVSEDTIGIDSTGFRLDQASADYQFRNGKAKRDWLKGT